MGKDKEDKKSADSKMEHKPIATAALATSIPTSNDVSKARSPFMILPPELRNMIYELLLPARVTAESSLLLPFKWSPEPALSLLMVSRSIRDEVRKMLFKSATFVFYLYRPSDAEKVVYWIKANGEGLMSQIRIMEIHVCQTHRVVVEMGSGTFCFDRFVLTAKKSPTPPGYNLQLSRQTLWPKDFNSIHGTDKNALFTSIESLFNGSDIAGLFKGPAILGPAILSPAIVGPVSLATVNPDLIGTGNPDLIGTGNPDLISLGSELLNPLEPSNSEAEREMMWRVDREFQKIVSRMEKSQCTGITVANWEELVRCITDIS